MTAEQVFEIAMDKMDEREDNGTIDIDSTANYKAKAPGLLTSIQNELIRMGDYIKKVDFKPVNIKPVFYNTEGYTHSSEDIVLEDKDFKSYIFDVSGDATIVIDEYKNGDWFELARHEVSNEDMSFTEIKGTITPQTKSIRITFTGEFYYNVKNLALYIEKFNNVNNIPVGGDYFRYVLPSDFVGQREIRKITADKRALTDNYEWDGVRTLLVPKENRATIEIEYIPVPPDITSLDTELVIDDRTAKTTMVNTLVTELMLADENNNAVYYNSKVAENNVEVGKQKRLGTTEIIQAIDTSLNVYG